MKGSNLPRNHSPQISRSFHAAQVDRWVQVIKRPAPEALGVAGGAGAAGSAALLRIKRLLNPGAEPHPAVPLRIGQDLGVEHGQEVVEEHDYSGHEGSR